MLAHTMASDGSNGSIVATDVELQDFCITMAFAGHDTTLSTMQTMLHLLDGDSTVFEELRQEVDKAWDGKAAVSRDLLNSLHKCKAFAVESMRLVPPVANVVRKIDHDAVLPTCGSALPAGTTLMVNIKSVMDANLGATEQIRLKNWLDDKDNFIEHSLVDFARLSVFGTGGRMCLGYKFAMDEMLVFLLNLLHTYDFTVVKRSEVKFPFHFYRVWTTFKHRHANLAPKE